MVALKTAVVVFAVITVVCAVYLYGTGTMFSLEAYINGIVNQFEAIPTIEGLAAIWNEDVKEGSEGSATSEQGFWDKATAFFESVGTFFVNLWESVVYIVSMITGVFKVLPCFLPWNAAVPVVEVWPSV